MKTKSIILTSVSIIAIILLTGCSKKKEETLVSSSNSVVATCNDFKEMISILEKNESGLQFIPLLPAEEQEKIYLKLVEEYIVSNFLIKKNLEENKKSTTDKFKDEYKS